MDCIGCDNRAAHSFDTAEGALDKKMVQVSPSQSLPLLRKEGLALLNTKYESQGVAMPRIIAFSPENEFLYAVTAKGSETSRLVHYDIGSGACTTLFENSAFDVATVYLDPGTREIGAIAVLEEKLVWTPMNPATTKAFRRLTEGVHGEVSNVAGSSDGSTLLCRCQMETVPAEYHLYKSTRIQCRCSFRAVRSCWSMGLRR